MPAMSNYLHDKILNQQFRATAFTFPATMGMALAAGDLPTADDTGATFPEVSGGAYARKDVSPSTSNWNLSDDGATNKATVTFAQATADWLNPHSWGLFDSTSANAGNMLFFGPITNPGPVTASTPPVSFTPNAIRISLDAGAIMNDYLHDNLMNQIFRGTAYTFVSAIYFCLCTEMPTADDTGSTIVEPGSAYARQLVTANTTNWAASDNGTYNLTTVTFPQATGSWGNVVGWAIADAVTTGNVLFQGPLKTPATITASSPPATFLPGNIMIALDGLTGGM